MGSTHVIWDSNPRGLVVLALFTGWLINSPVGMLDFIG